MTEEPQENAGEPQAGEPPAIVLYAIYAMLAAVLICVLIVVAVYV